MKESDENNLVVFKHIINKKRLVEGVPKSFPSKTLNIKLESLSEVSVNEVGFLAEKMYNDYLNIILDPSISTITWVNGTEESGKPFDFIVTLGDETLYIDVKATRGIHNNDIYLSKREYSFALEHPDNYYVARLYEWETDKGKLRAGNFNVKLQNLFSILHLIKFK